MIPQMSTQKEKIIKVQYQNILVWHFFHLHIINYYQSMGLFYLAKEIEFDMFVKFHSNANVTNDKLELLQDEIHFNYILNCRLFII